MTPIWITGLIATFFGVWIGGLVSFLINGYEKSIGTIYAACTGVILGLISFEIFPEALHNGNWITSTVGFVAGMILFSLIHLIFHFPSQSSKEPNIKAGFLLTIALSIHNIPMGIMMGFSQQSDITSALLQTLVLHNIPEGMILFAPLFVAGFKLSVLFFFSVIVAIPIGAGAFFGGIMGMQNDIFLAFLTSLSVGMIFMITIKEILPESIRHSSNGYSLFVTILSFFSTGAYLLFL